jgi:hypothetical protein
MGQFIVIYFQVKVYVLSNLLMAFNMTSTLILFGQSRRIFITGYDLP